MTLVRLILNVSPSTSWVSHSQLLPAAQFLPNPRGRAPRGPAFFAGEPERGALAPRPASDGTGAASRLASRHPLERSIGHRSIDFSGTGRIVRRDGLRCRPRVRSWNAGPPRGESTADPPEATARLGICEMAASLVIVRVGGLFRTMRNRAACCTTRRSRMTPRAPRGLSPYSGIFCGERPMRAAGVPVLSICPPGQRDVKNNDLDLVLCPINYRTV